MNIKNSSGRDLKVNESMVLAEGQIIARKDLPLDDGDLNQCLRRGDLEVVVTAVPVSTPKDVVKKTPRKRKPRKEG